MFVRDFSQSFWDMLVCTAEKIKCSLAEATSPAEKLLGILLHLAACLFKGKFWCNISAAREQNESHGNSCVSFDVWRIWQFSIIWFTSLAESRNACKAGQGCHNFTVEQNHFRKLFHNSNRAFPLPCGEADPSGAQQRGGKTLVQHFLVPVSWLCSHTAALQPSQCPRCSCRSGKKHPQRNKLKFSAARGWLCGAGKYAACRVVTLFLGQALCRSSSMGVWGVASPSVHPGPWRSFPEVCPCSLLHGKAREGLWEFDTAPFRAHCHEELSSAQTGCWLYKAGAFWSLPQVVGITYFCCAVVSRYSAHGTCVCVYRHICMYIDIYVAIYMCTCRCIYLYGAWVVVLYEKSLSLC